MTCLEAKGAPPAAPLAWEGDRAPSTAFKGSGASVAPVVPIPATAAEPVRMPAGAGNGATYATWPNL